MQGSAVAIKGSVGSEFQNRRILSSFGQFSRTSSRVKNLCMSCNNYCFGSRVDSLGMGAQLASARIRVETMFRSSVKTRSVRAPASGDDLEDLVSNKPQGKSSGSVFPCVGVACLGAALFGYHLGVVNGALEYLAKDLGIAENTVLQGWVVSATLAGATVGSFTGGALADKFGRTKTFQLDAIPPVLGPFLSATAQSVQMMIIGRLLAGIGIGISSALVPLYISEISPTEIRGALGSVNQLFICIGILAALVAGLPLAANPLWWRTMFDIAIIPAVLMALGMAVSAESPRWLFQQGKLSQAETAIKKLWGKERVAEVMQDLRASSQGSTEPEAGWFDLFSSRYWKATSCLFRLALALFQLFYCLRYLLPESELRLLPCHWACTGYPTLSLVSIS